MYYLSIKLNSGDVKVIDPNGYITEEFAMQEFRFVKKLVDLKIIACAELFYCSSVASTNVEKELEK